MNPPTVVFNNSLWGSIQQEILPRRHFFGSGNQIFVDSFIATVEPRLSGPPLSGTSIIRLGSFLFIRLNNSENGRVPTMRMRVAAVTMETYLLIFCACADNQWHCCLSIKWVDQGVVYLFDYPAYSLIWPASGTKVSG